jgi:hypothetical protein
MSLRMPIIILVIRVGWSSNQGAPNPGFDLWFREGVVVPEPGTWALLLVGFGLLAWRKGQSVALSWKRGKKTVFETKALHLHLKPCFSGS